jgi:predicted CopG family antitoxin
MAKIEKESHKETTIIIKNEIRERLNKLGHKGQTYNDIITKLLDSKNNKIDLFDHGVGVIDPSESSSNP